MAKNRNFVMVTVSGKDRPGITARFARILMERNVEVVDIEQASLQNLLGLYFMLAGLGISFNARKSLDRFANVTLGKSGMMDILHLLGITEEDVSDALACKRA